MIVQTSFLRALGWAVLIHIVLLAAVGLSWKGTPRDYQVDFFFWGEILRPQELEPIVVKGGGDPAGIRILLPSPPVTPVQMSAWRLGSSVEKPAPMKESFEDKGAPSKFPTNRVELDDPLPGTSGGAHVDIPDAPRILLRRPGT